MTAVTSSEASELELHDENDQVVRLSEFVERMHELEVVEIEIPEFHIHNWPSAFAIRIKLDKKRYQTIKQSRATGLYKLATEKKNLVCRISKEGIIRFQYGTYRGDSYASRGLSVSPLDRARTLLIFSQFQEEICERVFEVAREEAQVHKALDEQLREALKPFMPSLMLDRLN